MRVIAGRAKGRRLFGPKTKFIRPALDKVKQAVFNILYDVRGLDALDLFAGSGSVGIEALSRGAASCVFVDKFKNAVEIIRRNIFLCGFEKSLIIKSDVKRALKILARKGKKFDLVFVDPPYLKNLVNPTIELLGPIIKPSSIIIIEHHPKELIEPHDGFIITSCRKYGQTLISFVKKDATFCV